VVAGFGFAVARRRDHLSRLSTVDRIAGGAYPSIGYPFTK
jgi:hypothetical protein